MTSVDLRTERLVLTPVNPEDVGSLLSIRRTSWVSRWWGTGDDEPGWPLSDADFAGYTIRSDSKIVGLIEYYEVASPSVRYAGIDLFLDEAACGLGLGREAVKRVMLYLTDEKAHHRLVIDPAASNVRAIEAYRACGFLDVGVMRSYERNPDGSGWHDALLMEYVS